MASVRVSPEELKAEVEKFGLRNLPWCDLWGLKPGKIYRVKDGGSDPVHSIFVCLFVMLESLTYYMALFCMISKEKSPNRLALVLLRKTRKFLFLPHINQCRAS